MSKQLLLVKLLQLLVLFCNLQIDEDIMPTRYRTTEVHTVNTMRKPIIRVENFRAKFFHLRSGSVDRLPVTSRIKIKKPG
jgi:hypothetical protein